MKILSIDHVQIAIPAGEEEQARKFFIDVLRMQEIPKPPQFGKRGGLWLEAGEVQLHLGVEAEFHPARKAHPAFVIDDLQAFMVRIREAGGEVDTTQPPLEGYKRVHIFDPFGNRIELMEKSG
jgi:predicted enzyme related to lactoylglutathione lyase